jgi:hypothetical protein
MQDAPPAIQPINRRGFIGCLFASLTALLPTRATAAASTTIPANPTNLANARYFNSTEPDGTVIPENIRDWQSDLRFPVWESETANESLFIEAISRNEILYGSYDRWGDTSIRRISPILLFQLEIDNGHGTYEDEVRTALGAQSEPHEFHHDVIMLGPTYLEAWDHDKHAPRIFQAAQFTPRHTAPWMRPFTDYKTAPTAKWNAHLHETAADLQQRGVQPV